MQDTAPPSGVPLRSLSSFEKLPNELRHEIYSCLGIPIAGSLWVEQHKKRDGSLQPLLVNRYGVQHGRYGVQHGRASEDKTVCHHERREQIRAVVFHRFDTKETRIRSRQSAEPIAFNQFAISDACKSIRAETLELLFGHARVVFDYELTTEAIFSTCTAVGGTQKATYHRMAVNTDYFAFMTRVRLSEKVALTHINCVGGPHPIYRSDKVPATIALTRQISSIFFIADHCPELVELRTDLSLPGCLDECSIWPLLGSESPKRVSIKSLLSAFFRVVDKCPKLKRILIPKAVYEKRGSRIFGGSHEILSITTLTLDFDAVEVASRREHARLWLKSVLDDLAFNRLGER